MKILLLSCALFFAAGSTVLYAECTCHGQPGPCGDPCPNIVM